MGGRDGLPDGDTGVRIGLPGGVSDPEAFVPLVPGMWPCAEVCSLCRSADLGAGGAANDEAAVIDAADSVTPIRREAATSSGGAMGRLETAKFPIANAYGGTGAAARYGMPPHPQWCCRDWCSAYEPEDEVDRRYHRSKPYLVETD